jgi:glucose/arabinose dehydrogenase
VRRSSCLLALLALVAAGAAARGAADAVRVPAGFRVEVYARGLERPTALAWGPGGSLYATQEGGTVVRVKPRKTVARGFATPLAAVLSVRPDGRDLRVVPRGLRNPFGLAVDPETGKLYASVNERDELGPNEPAETVVEIRAGRRFGWLACRPSYRRKRLEAPAAE